MSLQCAWRVLLTPFVRVQSSELSSSTPPQQPLSLCAAAAETRTTNKQANKCVTRKTAEDYHRRAPSERKTQSPHEKKNNKVCTHTVFCCCAEFVTHHHRKARARDVDFFVRAARSVQLHTCSQFVVDGTHAYSALCFVVRYLESRKVSRQVKISQQRNNKCCCSAHCTLAGKYERFIIHVA